MGLREEIFEQPAAIARLLHGQRAAVEEAARRIRERHVKFVFLTARGTSDNAGLYAKYLWGAFNRLPIALAAPSLFTAYEAPPDVRDALVLGISQSGQSPDIVGVLRQARQQGALTLAITNDAASPLAEMSDLVIDTMAGPENAVAASKSYTTQLVAIAMLSAALDPNPEQPAWLARLPGLVEQALALDDTVKQASQRYRYMSQCVVLGRGFNYATAYEWSLKLKELAYVVAEPYSSADFQHGPIALIQHGFPVFAVVPDGKVADELIALLTQLVQNRKVELVTISNHPQALGLANTPVKLPEDLPEWISPIPAIIPAQLFCYHLTRAKGFDTEGPRGLTKVTLTW